MQLSSLRLIYIDKLEEHGYPNDQYRSVNLMNRLQSHPDISPQIVFCKVYSGDKGCLSFYLFYSSNITVAKVIACAYKLASVDKISDIALMLRSAIQKGFQGSKASPWPPAFDNIATVDIPQELITFLNIVIARKPNVLSDKVHRLVLSIGQDLYRCITGGDWKLPKHVFLCMTVRHLYRSKHLATILSRLGHCESYDFGLELETAMAKALDETSTLLTPHIVKGEGNVLFRSEWDNLNKILTNGHEHNVVNFAGGIMVQEVATGHGPTKERTSPTSAR